MTNEMSKLPRWVRNNTDNIELGCHWADLQTAAALLSRTAWMPDGTPSPDHEYPPASLKAVIRKMDAKGRVFVIYLISGNPAGLRRLRYLFMTGCLYVHPRERLVQLDKLIGIYLEAKEVAQTRAQQMNRGQYHVRDSQP